MCAAWARVLKTEYEHLLEGVEHRHLSVIDLYGASSSAEFFAVVTECFFEKPIQLKRHHPRRYEQSQLFCRQDPAALLERATAEG